MGGMSVCAIAIQVRIVGLGNLLDIGTALLTNVGQVVSLSAPVAGIPTKASLPAPPCLARGLIEIRRHKHHDRAEQSSCHKVCSKLVTIAI